MNINNDPLTMFHPLVRKWFSERMGAPTEIQAKAWPEICSGKHVLVTSPTGTGKTLTAFLWAINQLITGAWTGGQVSVLYVSPLKALNNDVQKNLLKPIDELSEYFHAAGIDFPSINVLTRSGDTPYSERRRMLRRPPEILITTPESLNLLISSINSRAVLGAVTTVIIDEIHAIISTKRGTHLITAIDRLIPVCGEFQRVALSATVNPIEKIADFVGGYRLEGGADPYHYKKRNVCIINSGGRKRYEIKVSFPENAHENIEDDSWWPALVRSFKEIIGKNKSVLFFANNRRLTEKIARLINEDEEEPLAYSHHGSLSREIRMTVEQKLKNGELKAIVATNSLELGIDIGDLDAVVLIQAPPAVTSAIQRIGRSGHRVGDASRGIIYPAHGRDFIESAVIARSIADQDIEPQNPIECPLDVLAQIIVSMTGVEKWDIDKLYAFVKTSYPYRDLPRKQFDSLLDMLAGRFAGTMLRELKSRVSIDRLENTVHAKEGMLRLVYLSGGTIPDRGYFDLRVRDSHAKIGELDEEFVWERSINETFVLGSQTWRIQRITHNEVEVVPVEAKPGIFPFWRAEGLDRDFHFSEKIADFLEYADCNIDNPDFKNELCDKYYMENSAADELISYLKSQRSAAGYPLPHRHHILIEHIEDPLNKSDIKHVILHTMWGGRVNRPFALALSSAWEGKYRNHLETVINNDCIMLMLPYEFKAGEIFDLIDPGSLEYFLRLKLEKTGFFGARFRENAGRALLLPRADFRKRLPLWLNRLRSKKLLDSIMNLDDFPILLETWRTCLKDEFDIDKTKQMLDEIANGMISLRETYTNKASPFAGGLIWKQTNKYMYEDDTPYPSKVSNLNQELLKEVIFSSNLHPMLSGDLIKIFEDKLKRTARGYAPRSSDDLLDWIKDRLLIPENEWEELLSAVRRDSNRNYEEVLTPIADKILWVDLPGSTFHSISAVENLPRILSSFQITRETISVKPVLNENSLLQKLNYAVESIFQDTHSSYKDGDEEASSLNDFLMQWLSFYGPVDKQLIKNILGIDDALIDDLLGSLAKEQNIIIDRIRESYTGEEICDSGNLETLLRMSRRSRQPSFQALGLEYLQLFCASFQGLTGGESDDPMEKLKQCFDRLFGFPAPAAAWEEYILPARIERYYSSWLDSLMQSSDLVWFGCGNKRVAFSFYDDLELYNTRQYDRENNNNKLSDNIYQNEISGIFPDINGKYSFFDILNHSKMDTRSLTEKLWHFTWNGFISNDSFPVLRKGILNNFAPFEYRHERSSVRRSGFNRWASTRPVSGNWYAINHEQDRDAVETEEIIKDRVRQLFKRYGIIFRELIANEIYSMQWGRVFKTLRLMELSGEILSGYFFKDIPGIQFISHEAFRFLNDPLPDNAIFWMNAADPASVCGIKLEGLKSLLPSRLSSTYLVFHGRELVLVSKRNHKILEFGVKPDNPFIVKYLSFFKVMLARDFNPLGIITINIINNMPALKSEYAEPLMNFGFRKQYNGLELVKEY